MNRIITLALLVALAGVAMAVAPVQRGTVAPVGLMPRVSPYPTTYPVLPPRSVASLFGWVNHLFAQQRLPSGVQSGCVPGSCRLVDPRLPMRGLAY
ncbi:MAG TPA: hypothetical protein VMH22_14285 [bacterium]|nr:hypothetical protein [bacterium]